MPTDTATSDTPLTVCPRCNGTGTYNAPSRFGERCFGCNGTGRPTAHAFTAAGEREITAFRAAAALPRPSRNGERNWTEFATRHPAAAAWLQSPAAGSFGASLIRGCKRYGGLTMRQMAAVQRNLAMPGIAIAAAPPTVPSGQISGPSVDAVRWEEAVGRRPIPAAPIVGATPEGVPVTEQDVRHGAQVTLSSMVDAIQAERDAIRAEPIAASRPPPMSSVVSAVYRALTERRPAAAPPPVVPVEGAPFFNSLAAITPPPAPSSITIPADPVRRAMDAAAASGLRKVKLSLGQVTFKLSGSRFSPGQGMILCYFNGSYRGWIDRFNLFHPSRLYEASNAIMDGQTGSNAIDAFRAAAADPQAAARTHGMDTGYCSCCRRLLTDPPSVMAGIGPICIRRFGWSF